MKRNLTIKRTRQILIARFFYEYILIARYNQKRSSKWTVGTFLFFPIANHIRKRVTPPLFWGKRTISLGKKKEAVTLAFAIPWRKTMSVLSSNMVAWVKT